MELLPRNLRERLHVGSLRVREALPLMLALCRAVGHAAANQFLHLDIKPSNVLLDDQNVPKLCDFGLALRFSQKDRLTEWRAGTTENMAPEQFRGQTAMLSERTDVYGLGALLYECLSGKQPLLPTAQSWSPPVPLRKVLIGIPKGLESICQRCLAEDPETRYATA